MASLVSTIALYVFDEAMTGFLPLPTFSFGVWLGGLIAGIILGYSLTPLIARGNKVIRIATIVIGVTMVGNALGHLLGAIYVGRVFRGCGVHRFCC